MISGPTYSGKSIYVKQLCTSLVALVVFLAHIRSFVPAEAAVIGLTDRIFKRVSRKATMAVQQSAFMIDLYQISFMLRHATSRSLCIIDEFGKGILVPDGVGLLCAILHHVASQDVPPKVVLFWHVHTSVKIFDEGYLPKVLTPTIFIVQQEWNLDLTRSCLFLVARFQAMVHSG
uniref:DNA mismatch repair proteins mutS family domain-containing protein n=1 Tax=Physcomitrium patens TaxID=3218 RepID=A0A2K1J379_PHYPA|nr:hypothetical protein PHYPA_021838 [Physcomitrium patens]